MKTMLLASATLLAVAWGASGVFPAPAPSPVPPSSAASAPTASQRERICRALGAIAASAFDAKLRGVPLASLQAINDAQARRNGSSEAVRLRIRAASAIGYETRTSAGAEQRAFTFCMSNTL